MIARIWSGESPLWRLLLPLSWLYGLISSLIRFTYRAGWRKRYRAPVPVVVVGNLTVGGNGKTPVVIWLIEQLMARGLRVGVISRGYGATAPYYPYLLDACSTADQAGDEPVLIFQRTGAPVAIAPRRGEAAAALLAAHPLDIIVTDDGLQHYALERDYEIVVIDGQRRFGNGWWLPAGPMRERDGRLTSVDAVIVNGGISQPGEIAMTLVPARAVNLVTGERCPPESLSPAIAMAGIGHPPRFFATLEASGVSLTQCIALNDHQTMTPEAVAAFCPPQTTLLMTEKDAVKCRAFAQPEWWYLPVDAQLAQPQATRLIDTLCALVA